MDEETEFIVSRLSDRFWDTVALAKSDWHQFRTMVHEMEPHALWQLYWTYRAAMGVLRRNEYQVYADPELVEDSLDDLASWIVAQGKDYYMSIVQNPEWMPPDVPANAFPFGRPLNEMVLALPVNRLGGPDDDSYFFE